MDSGAKGFCDMVEGMVLGTKGKLDADMRNGSLLARAALETGDDVAMDKVDHSVVDATFQFCTECARRLRHVTACTHSNTFHQSAR